MPSMICSEPGCNSITESGKCGKHLSGERDNFYSGRPWRRTRKLKLKLNPFCEVMLKCDGTMPAVTAHHVKKRREYPELALAIENLQSACESCHNTLTGRGE